jgi:SnoaL-like domain
MRELNVGDVERLVAIEAIKQLKARYYRFLDTHNWDALEMVFTTDGVMDVSVPDRIVREEEGIYRGRKAIREFAQKAVGGAQTIDHALMPEIEVLSPIAAKGVWAQEDRVFWAEGANKSLHGHGYEYETYRVEDGEWRIASTKLVRIRTEFQRA